MNEEARTVRCPGCGQVVEGADAQAKGAGDEASPLTCPTCGAGFDADGKLVHEPAIGP